MSWLRRPPASASIAASIRPPRARTLAPAAGPASAPGRRWVWTGMSLGALASLASFAPASWLAHAVTQASGERVVLADAQGTIWQGSAVTVLTGGAGSRDARALPGRLAWTLRPTLWGGPGARISLSQACCLVGTVTLTAQAGWNKLQLAVQPDGASPELGHWPASLLTGLGTPWNTLQPGGVLAVSAQGLVLRWSAGRFSLQGQTAVELRDFSSRLTTLARLGSYRAALQADATQGGTARVSLTTLDGALQLSGEGSWSASGLRLRGEATATPENEAALNNLLNIIGRRQGARSLISIG